MENWSRVAEDLLRAGSATSLQWDGLTITTHFQPILRIRPVECAGYEALLRAVDADGEPADPQAIFRDARAAGRLIELDRTCRALHLRNFATVDPGEGKLFLNVHPEAAVEDLANMREFGALIRYYGLVAKRLCVEILPHACLREERLADAARAYRELGVTVAVDHFASGSSNFDRVAAIRPPLVKLRRSVIADTVGRVKAGRRVDAVIELLRESGAQVVLEDVETAQDAMLAIASGAAYAQGNYLASPSARIGGEALGAGMLRELLRIGSEEAAAVEG
ncbi:MAG TPA: EAL domain-containing protein [Usitatibacter sp.]|nr:EAL domain-containing protein [Usitatibacter sp.]